jgi:trehalose 6-phosphate phosphatase
MRHHLLSPEGELALSRLLRGQPLLAFDFDGTLAATVARPEAAQVSTAVAKRLKVLSARLPVAVVSGRAVSDVRQRLGFQPRFLVGNHGAEFEGQQPPDSGALDALRLTLQSQAVALRHAGVAVEDKGLSLALHYRLARDRVLARQQVDHLLGPLQPALRVFGGKLVVNVTAADAPDKAQAVQALVQRSGASAAFFAGDDVNDEPVFRAAPEHWLTLRVGRDAARTDARYFLDGPQEMALLLDRMLALSCAATPTA